MARNNNATTVTELINELEALNDILSYIDMRRDSALESAKEYAARFEETGEDYYSMESSAQNTQANAFLKYKQMLIDWAIK